MTGCGGSSKAQDGAGDKNQEAAGVTTTSAETKRPGSSKAGPRKDATAGTAKGKDEAASAAGALKQSDVNADEDTTTRTMDIWMTLAETCVRPGGVQTITVNAPHGTAAGFDTYYADGLSGLHEGFHGGNMAGWTDETDTWTHTFTVAATAPPGQAVVVVLAVHDEYGRGETGDKFVVADPLGLCDPVTYD